MALFRTGSTLHKEQDKLPWKSLMAFGGNSLQGMSWVNDHGLGGIVIDDKVCVVVASAHP